MIQLTSRFRIYFFHEGKPTNLKGTLQFIVDEESASPSIQDVERASIQQDHLHMCKFENESAPSFHLVAEAVQRFAGQAPEIIEKRWDSEGAERRARKEAEVEKIIPGSHKWKHVFNEITAGIQQQHPRVDLYGIGGAGSVVFTRGCNSLLTYL